MLPFDFVVPGVPISAQAKSDKARREWKRRVGQAAVERWPRKSGPVAAELSVTVIYYYVDSTNLDVDNIAKPILDALVGLTYESDGLITQLTLRKTPLTDELRLVDPPDALAAALAQARRRDFVYVRLGGPPVHEEMPA